MVSLVYGSAQPVSNGLGSAYFLESQAALHMTFETGNSMGVSAGTVQVRSTGSLPPAPAKKNTPSTYCPSHCVPPV